MALGPYAELVVTRARYRDLIGLSASGLIKILGLMMFLNLLIEGEIHIDFVDNTPNWLP